MTPSSHATSRTPSVLPAALTCALVAVLSILPPSTSRILIWPWAGFAAAGWLLALGTVFYRIAAGRPHARFGGLIDAGFVVLALAAVASAFTSPVCGAILPHVLPFLGICALPYLLLPWLHSDNSASKHRFLALTTGLCLVILAVSLFLWLNPSSGFRGWPLRNVQPFGHSNTAGSFSVLAATWLAWSAFSLNGRARFLAASGSALAVATALSSQSRGAILALAAAAGIFAAIRLLGRRRYFTFAALTLLILVGTLAASSRLRELVFHQRWNTSDQESNRQRTAMILGGVALGNERPLLGWGAGSVPHVFPRVRAPLPGTADNFLHLHNTPAQLWSTLGAAGVLGGLLLCAGIVRRLRSAPWTPARAALAAGLCGAATVLLFDHPFSAPAFALLTAAHLAAWAAPAPARATRPARLACGAGLLAVLAIIPSAARDLAARAAYSSSLDAADRKDADTHFAELQRAAALAPADPYYGHQLASVLLGGPPVLSIGRIHPAAAIPILRASLDHNPDLEYAHYNLGWLLLDSAPAEAAAHFRAAARLAPQRGGVYFGLGLALLHCGDSTAATRALATECLNNPAFFWSPEWHSPPDATLPTGEKIFYSTPSEIEWRVPVLAALRPAVLASLNAAPLPATEASSRLRKAWSLASPPLTDGPRYGRSRTGYGVLMGHPDGPVPSDANRQIGIELPPDLAPLVPPKGWLPGPLLLGFLDNE